MIKTNKELLDFKGSPKYILESLKIFQQYSGNWKKIKSELIKMATEKESIALPRVMVSAYITPMLRNLKLINGEGNDSKITIDGTQCIESFENELDDGYRKRLAYQIIMIDEENINLIPFIKDNFNSIEKAITQKELKEKLFLLGIINAEKPTPVMGWIQLLTFVELMSTYNKKFYIRTSQYDAMKKGEKKLTKKALENAIRNTAKKLKSPDTAYVPIPKFRDHVCNELGISSFVFNKIIKTQPHGFGKTRLMFATPIKKIPGGIILRGKYYYFIAVYT